MSVQTRRHGRTRKWAQIREAIALLEAATLAAPAVIDDVTQHVEPAPDVTHTAPTPVTVTPRVPSASASGGLHPTSARSPCATADLRSQGKSDLYSGFDVTLKQKQEMWYDKIIENSVVDWIEQVTGSTKGANR